MKLTQARETIARVLAKFKHIFEIKLVTQHIFEIMRHIFEINLVAGHIFEITRHVFEIKHNYKATEPHHESDNLNEPH